MDGTHEQTIIEQPEQIEQTETDTKEKKTVRDCLYSKISVSMNTMNIVVGVIMGILVLTLIAAVLL